MPRKLEGSGPGLVHGPTDGGCFRTGSRHEEHIRANLRAAEPGFTMATASTTDHPYATEAGVPSVPANVKPGSVRASARGERVVEARGPEGTVAMQGWVRY